MKRKRYVFGRQITYSAYNQTSLEAVRDKEPGPLSKESHEKLKGLKLKSFLFLSLQEAFNFQAFKISSSSSTALNSLLGDSCQVAQL